jgi:lipoprotein NlpD
MLNRLFRHAFKLSWLKAPGFGGGKYLLCGLLLVLSGCVSDNYAPISDLERPKTVTKGIHTVRSGDTLFSIAWRYGRDYRELAAVNGNRPPYTIFVNQRISLSKQPVSSPQTKRQSQKVASVERKKQSVPAPASSGAVNSPIVWSWPVRGTLISKFSGTANKGIDISAKKGTPVKAAAAGTVVYAGSGLVGYGNLVIIKHSESFLSAYAHNKKILVRENRKVRANEKIAELGASGANTAKLHFEIRKNGKPVNPLWYLPK